MRSPVSRFSAAAVLVLAIAGVALWFHGAGATHAFADFVEPIVEAKTAKFKITTEIKGPPAATIKGEVMVLSATRMRQEMEAPNMPQGIMIFDWGRGKSLTLDPTTKKAMVVSLANMNKEQIAQQDTFGSFRSILLDARDNPNVKREPLGEKNIDGRQVVGFRVSSRGMVVSLWGDPKTGLPVLAETTMSMYPDAKTTMSDFVFNVDMDESLFSVEPPPGYTVDNMKVDVSPPEEEDLIETFRIYTELSDGVFPDSLDMQLMMQAAAKMVGMKNALEMMCEKFVPKDGKLDTEQRQELKNLLRTMLDFGIASEKKKLSEERMAEIEEQMEKFKEQMPKRANWGKEEMREAIHAEVRKTTEASMKKFMEVQVPLQRGLLFVFTMPPEANAHYAGKGVSLGAANTPILWYRPKDAKKYRAIYADLSVHDADTPPSVPDAQPVLAPSSPKE